MRRLVVAVALCAGALWTLGAPAALATTGGPDVQHLRYRFGPVAVTPGQNTISFAATDLKPKVPGYITRFKPDLEYADGRGIPPVDVIHLHHGVWLIDGDPTFAAGEEKTVTSLPDGYGLRYTPQQKWIVNHMIHNLTPTAASVYLTWEIDFVPDGTPTAARMTGVYTQWMDVAGIRAYPVFDAVRGSGHGGRLTFPDDAPRSTARGAAQSWTITRPTTLVQTAGHLHPGGLSTYLDVTRAGRTVRLFTSTAKYFEPAGAVSWDVAMTATPANWRVLLSPGDVVTVHGTYDVRRASWYEAMAIMPVAVQDGVGTSGVDPFAPGASIPTKGAITHGHLAENDNHGGSAIAALPDQRDLLTRPLGGRPVTIRDFAYSQGDIHGIGVRGRVPVVRQGGTITFRNLEGDTIYHTITACRAPCNRATGIAYPLADGRVTFDSGELGFGPEGATAAANRATWKTPKGLTPGTYTYFCRIHPFMRGAFEVRRR